MFRRIIIFFIVLSSAAQAYGQHRVSAGLRTGYPFSPQDELLQGVNSLGRPLRVGASADIQYAFYFPGSSYQGVGVSVFSLFDHKDVGTPVSVYILQGARIAQLSRTLSLDYEWNFGASFGWHRTKDYPFNTIMGTKVNAYINGSIMFSWQPSPEWKISLGPDFSHYSNGHTQLPNAGLNIIGMRLNAASTFGKAMFSVPAESYPDEHKWTENISYDITVFGAPNKSSVYHNDRYFIVDGHFATAGLFVNPFYEFHKHFRAGLSLDFNYNEGANICHHIAALTPDQRVRFFRPPLSEQMSLGMSLRAELVMPIFSVHFGVGHNFIYKGHALEGLYQIIALKTRITERLYIHTGYQFWNFKNPDHLLLGLGWRFGNVKSLL